MMRAALRISIVCFALSSIPLALHAQEGEKPLPELQSFLKEIRKNLFSDRLLLSQYTFLEKSTQLHLEKNGKVKKTEERLVEVYPSLEPGQSYRRLIAKDGKPVDSKELEEQDRKHDRNMQELLRKRENESARDKEKRLAREAEERRKEGLLIDELFQLYDIHVVGREILDGYPAIQLAFRARPNAKPRSRETKTMMKIAGRAWFSETEFQVIRLEAELQDTVSVGLGMLARLNKGAKAVFLRRKVNDEIWLPAESRFTGSARIMLLKGLNIDTRTEYSEYRKFSVQTSVTIQPPQPQP
jgi:hypothetical protein